MTFALSGSVITQSGTDTSLSGISGIAGVTNVTTGGTAPFTVYRCALKLRVAGTLTIDPEREMFITDYAPTSTTDGRIVSVASAGVLNIGIGAVQNSYTRYRKGIGVVVSSSVNSSFTPESGRFNVESGGTLNLNGGGVIFPTGSVFFEAGSIVTVNQGVIIGKNGAGATIVRNSSSSLTVNGLTIVACPFYLQSAPANLSALAVEHANQAVVVYGNSNGFGTTSLITVSNFDKQGGNVADIEFLDQVQSKILNSVSGSNLIVRNLQSGISGVRTQGYVYATKQVSYTVATLVGTAIQNAVLYCKDTNNGARVNGNGFNDLADKVYTATSNASGVFSTQEIVIAIWNQTSTVSLTSAPVDYRGKENNFSDKFDFYFAHYNYLIQTDPSVVLKGSGVLSRTATLFVDSAVSESSKTTVEAYTHANTLERIYDLCKSWKVDNFSLQYPAIASLLCVADGTILDFGSLNVVFDGSAVSTRTVTTGTNTITFKTTASLSGTKFNRIKTTGTITFSNGADYSVIAEDSTGTRYPAVLFSGFPSANNANGIAPAPRISLTNLRTSTTQAYTISGGSISLKLSDVGALPTDDVRVTVDAIGYIRPLDQTIKGNRTEPVSFVFEEWVNAKGQPIVGLESAANIDFDLVEERLLLPAGSITFYSALMRWENVTAGPNFYFFPTDAVRRFNFIEGFDGAKRVVIADFWTVASKPDDSIAPIISDFTVISETVTRDPFEHGLASTAPGLTTRPEVLIAFQSPGSQVEVTAIATNAITAASIANDAVVEIQAGLATSTNVTTAQTAILADIAALNDISAAEVWAVPTRALTDKANFSLSSAAEDSIVSKVWSATTRSLTTFGTLVADTVSGVWSAATRSLSDKTGFALTNQERTDIASAVNSALSDDFAAIPPAPNAATVASAVRSELTTELNRIDATISSRATQSSVNAIPTNTLASNDSRLNNLDATISSRASQTSVNAIPTNPVLTNDARLNNLDATISSRLADADYIEPTTPPTTSAIALAVQSQLSDEFASVLTAVGLIPVPDNASIAAIKAKTDAITISGGDVVATLNGEPVTLPSGTAEQILRLYQIAGFDASNPVDNAQTSITVAGITLNLSEPSPGVVRITRAS